MIIATLWFLASLMGLGALPSMALFGAAAWRESLAAKSLVQSCAIFLMMGLLTDHAIGLLSGDLRLQDAFAWLGLAGFAVVALAAIYVARSDVHTISQPNLRQQVVRITFCVLIIATFFIMTLAIFTLPLSDWDARSIWFFHGKVIFYDGGLHPSAFWKNPEYDWSHKDYPQLVSMLAARYADFTLGGWNEYAPKGALVPMMVAGGLGLRAVSNTSCGFILLLLGALAILNKQIWNGYMDGWLALEGCIAICALSRWATTSGSRQDLILGCAALGIALVLKNEGQLLCVVALVPLLYGVYRHHKLLRLYDPFLALAVLPFALWTWCKSQLALTGDLQSGDLAQRAAGVAGNGHELIYRLSYLAHAVARTGFLAESLAVFFVFGLCVGFRKSTAFVGGTAVLYGLGLIAVYLGTPRDFVWHVSTSIDRVVMLPTLLLLAGIVGMIPAPSATAVALRQAAQ